MRWVIDIHYSSLARCATFSFPSEEDAKSTLAALRNQLSLGNRYLMIEHIGSQTIICLEGIARADLLALPPEADTGAECVQC